FVAKASVFFHGVDREYCIRTFARYLKIEIFVTAPSHGLTHDLRPKLRISAPADPLRRPTCLHVGCECSSLPQTVLPTSQKRLIGPGFGEKHFGIRLGLGHHIT